MGSRLEKGSEASRKRIEKHSFDNEEGEEYGGSKFGGFSDYFRRKKLKLQNLDAELRSSSENPDIFKGIVAHVNGYTQPSLNDLHHMIVRYGGGFMQYLDGKTTVTHIIAANLTPKKAIEFKRYRIVKPAWIVDSIKTGKVLPWENYRVVDEGVGQRILGFNDGKITSHANTQQRTYREQTNSSWYTNQVKHVAEHIDNDECAQFPSSQAVTVNKNGAFFLESAVRRQVVFKPADTNDQIEKGPDPSNPESFGISSSLEDIFKEVEKQEPTQNLHAEETPKEGVFALQDEEIVHEPFKVKFLETSISEKTNPLLDSPSPPKKAKILTAEEHNILLLSDPHIRKSSTANPDFLKQFYSESRLHHLSTWKADLKARLQQMATDKSLSQKPQKRKPGSRRYIMHVDFDSFFCAVSLTSAPEFVDKPAVVAHGSGLGSEIASCNYPAREFGVKNGMWMKQALELCPDIKIFPYDFPAYEDASKHFYEAILDMGGIVQSVSVDEALVDISSLCISTSSGDDGLGFLDQILQREQKKAQDISQKLRQTILSSTGCAVSVGIGGNILLAKVALRKAKPAGQYLITPEEILEFIGNLKVQELPGVAYSIGGKLAELGVKSVKDVRLITKERLMTVLGPKTGEKIWDYSRGIDNTEVGEQVIRKSVSAEINWGIRFISQPEAEEFVQNLCVELQKRLLDAGVKGRQLTVKIMRRATDAPLDPPKHLGHGRCDTFNKSVTLGVATSSCETIGREAVLVLRGYGFSPGELRGLGVQMTKLEPINLKLDGRLDGSQKRISFKPAIAASKVLLQHTEDIEDPDSPRKPKATPSHPATAIVRLNESDKSHKKPLNLTGTQFIMPSQYDPAILAELPHDIRSKLLAQTKSPSTSRSESPSIESRSQSPSRASETPFPFRVGPEVFSALPKEMGAETLASYSSRDRSSGTQGILPQSPRKVRTLPPNKKVTTPTKKRSSVLFRSRTSKSDTNSTLKQSNLVTRKAVSAKEVATDSDEAQSDLDPEFLSALPEDIRAEVVAEHRRSRLVRRSGLSIVSKPNNKKPQDVGDMEQKKLRLPPRPPKPTFTTQNLSSLPELRDTLSQWYGEFSSEGPHADDISAIERYLRRVVCDERDAGKAVGVCTWLGWLIDEGEGSCSKAGKEAWKTALAQMKERIQEALQERGRGRVEF